MRISGVLMCFIAASGCSGDGQGDRDGGETMDGSFDDRGSVEGGFADRETTARIWKNHAAGGQTFTAVWAGSVNDALAVGMSGAAAHWNGTVWSETSTGTTADLRAVWGIGSEAWAVGDSGTVLHWDGSSWSVQRGTGHRLYGVWGSSRDDIWAVGGVYSNISAFVHSTDGTTWTETTTSGNLLYGISGRGEKDIWVGAAWGHAYHYDGAWTEPDPKIPSNGGADVVSVSTPVAGCVVGIGPASLYLKRTGLAWRLSDSLRGNAISCIEGTTICAAVSEDGTATIGDVYSEVTTWDRQMPTTANLRGVFARTASDIWAVGNDAIVHCCE